ncbi:hypothetical protein RhiirA5_349434 [Rhizophagus irregularis]|uniref:Uncharacterized protein n=2 Tax=Rhizophagus irregularis TaxID=588596 RepID=A0A2I1FY87_9GLOM|nr:hypothetical protein GLOIN_2v1574674 [Rhizophagus irregularis DAOM 181602=DAOM 197198]PKC15180.1 hypothetical protein RhiirA5_349434 [Rhizophagus irregularis]PKC76174.1 hypothetical protein RhiirA1_406653 [Rhizophagus irregularis]PKK73614.1 hypothetical protein RhiirC2_740470 [Rhizophagus irregularis]PKY21238.1 hypothetical protein RhiirB3_409237 [Rhizophagus irregularis]PKY39339.1 hypothetical protein RhiirA4_393316 [Rhizophagus irregularis]|eukprot:XP_025181401.1 hypothetical protein GLOIN_2v1574674 [Rhizophagus irregularis DAOM 181602=DAOM 197198]
MSLIRPFSYLSILFVLILLKSETSFAQSNFTELIECSAFATCGECTSHLACGFCVTTNKCVQGGWKGPFKDPEICTIDNWEYEYAQCFDTIFDFQKLCISTCWNIIYFNTILFVLLYLPML